MAESTDLTLQILSGPTNPSFLKALHINTEDLNLPTIPENPDLIQFNGSKDTGYLITWIKARKKHVYNSDNSKNKIPYKPGLLYDETVIYPFEHIYIQRTRDKFEPSLKQINCLYLHVPIFRERMASAITRDDLNFTFHVDTVYFYSIDFFMILAGKNTFKANLDRVHISDFLAGCHMYLVSDEIVAKIFSTVQFDPTQNMSYPACLYDCLHIFHYPKTFQVLARAYAPSSIDFIKSLVLAHETFSIFRTKLRNDRRRQATFIPSYNNLPVCDLCTKFKACTLHTPPQSSVPITKSQSSYTHVCFGDVADCVDLKCLPLQSLYRKHQDTLRHEFIAFHNLTFQEKQEVMQIRTAIRTINQDALTKLYELFKDSTPIYVKTIIYPRMDLCQKKLIILGELPKTETPQISKIAEEFKYTSEQEARNPLYNEVSKPYSYTFHM